MPNPDVLPNQGIAWQGGDVDAVNAAIQEVRPHQLIVGLPLQQKRRLAGHESSFLREHAPGAWKMTLTPPNARQRWKAGITDMHYEMVEDLQTEMIDAYKNEIRLLAEEGCSYVQLDSLALRHPAARGAGSQVGHRQHRPASHPRQPDRRRQREWRAATKAAGVTVALHMCRGNNRSAWITEGSYEPVAERAFNQLNVDRFLLEYDTERAGGFEPCASCRRARRWSLGLISTKKPQLESQDDLMRRIDEASKYVAIENLALTPAVRLRVDLPTATPDRGMTSAASWSCWSRPPEGLGLITTGVESKRNPGLKAGASSVCSPGFQARVHACS